MDFNESLPVKKPILQRNLPDKPPPVPYRRPWLMYGALVFGIALLVQEILGLVKSATSGTIETQPLSETVETCLGLVWLPLLLYGLVDKVWIHRSRSVRPNSTLRNTVIAIYVLAVLVVLGRLLIPAIHAAKTAANQGSEGDSKVITDAGNHISITLPMGWRQDPLNPMNGEILAASHPDTGASARICARPT